MVVLEDFEHGWVLAEVRVGGFAGEEFDGGAADAPDVRGGGESILFDYFRCHCGKEGVLASNTLFDKV